MPVMEMNDVFTLVGILVTLVFSVIAVWQSNRANEKSEEANELAERANDYSKKANEYSKKANEYSKKANEYSKEANEYSKEANKLAENAENTSKKALREQEKEFMPLIRCIGKIQICKKTIYELRNAIIFDFDGLTKDSLIRGLNDNGAALKRAQITSALFDKQRKYPEKEDEILEEFYKNTLSNRTFPCIEVEIENFGKGQITGVVINKLIIFLGNKVDYELVNKDEGALCLCYVETDDRQERKGVYEKFLLDSKESIKVYFILSKFVFRDEELTDQSFEKVEEKMRHMIDENNVSILMDLKIESINNTRYTQDFLLSTFENNKLVYNSIDKVQIEDILESIEGKSKKKN